MGPKNICELLVSVPRCPHVQHVLHLSPGACPTTHFLRPRGRCRIVRYDSLRDVSRRPTIRHIMLKRSRSISPRAPVPLNAHYYSSHSVFVTVFTPCFCAASLLALMQASKVVVRRLALSTYSTVQL